MESRRARQLKGGTIELRKLFGGEPMTAKAAFQRGYEYTQKGKLDLWSWRFWCWLFILPCRCLIQQRHLEKLGHLAADLTDDFRIGADCKWKTRFIRIIDHQ